MNVARIDTCLGRHFGPYASNAVPQTPSGFTHSLRDHTDDLSSVSQSWDTLHNGILAIRLQQVYYGIPLLWFKRFRSTFRFTQGFESWCLSIQAYVFIRLRRFRWMRLTWCRFGWARWWSGQWWWVWFLYRGGESCLGEVLLMFHWQWWNLKLWLKCREWRLLHSGQWTESTILWYRLT